MKNLVWSVVCVFLMACVNNEEVPDGILPDSTMKSILIEVSIVDASYNVSMSSPNAPKFKPELFYEQVLIQHHTNRAEFNRSMAFYARNSGRLQKIYEAALVDLSKRQVEASK